MSGFLQTLFYFGYTAVGCAALGVVTGTIGSLAAAVFVRAIFSGIKID
jgi:transmembrane 9 superfamily protein 2/4